MDKLCDRRDCRYFSTYTETCDFTLLNYRARQCPAENCREYKKREERRPWQIFVQRRPPVSPEERFEIADCGHEVYSGESIFSDENGRRLCPDCVDDMFRRLSTGEKACLLGLERRKVVQ